jgi:hypothetical protein
MRPGVDIPNAPVRVQHCTAQTVEIRFGKVECLADPEPGAPQHHDQSTQPCTVWTVAGERR